MGSERGGRGEAEALLAEASKDAVHIGQAVIGSFLSRSSIEAVAVLAGGAFTDE